jgi:hypothetical protein
MEGDLRFQRLANLQIVGAECFAETAFDTGSVAMLGKGASRSAPSQGHCSTVHRLRLPLDPLPHHSESQF